MCFDDLCVWHRVPRPHGLEWTTLQPCFENASQLTADSDWNEYLHAVYGTLSISDFPIDVRCFTFFWHVLLPQKLRTEFSRRLARQNDRPRNGEIVAIGRDAWQIYSLENRSLFLPVPSHDRMELYHDFDDCKHATQTGNTLAQVGFWAHFAPGSGVFAGVGRTLHVGPKGYGDACRAILGDVPVCSPCCTPTHVVLRHLALQRGYDSVQSCCGPRGGILHRNVYEVVFFQPRCSVNSSDSCPQFLQAGRRNARHCKCLLGRPSRCV